MSADVLPAVPEPVADGAFPVETALELIRTGTREQLEAAARLWVFQLDSVRVEILGARQLWAKEKATRKSFEIRGELPQVVTCEQRGHEYWDRPGAPPTCPQCTRETLRYAIGRMRGAGMDTTWTGEAETDE